LYLLETWVSYKKMAKYQNISKYVHTMTFNIIFEYNKSQHILNVWIKMWIEIG